MEAGPLATLGPHNGHPSAPRTHKSRYRLYLPSTCTLFFSLILTFFTLALYPFKMEYLISTYRNIFCLQIMFRFDDAISELQIKTCYLHAWNFQVSRLFIKHFILMTFSHLCFLKEPLDLKVFLQLLQGSKTFSKWLTSMWSLMLILCPSFPHTLHR